MDMNFLVYNYVRDNQKELFSNNQSIEDACPKT